MGDMIQVLILHGSALNFDKIFSYSLTLSHLTYLACIPLRAGVFSVILGFICEEIHKDIQETMFVQVNRKVALYFL